MSHCLLSNHVLPVLTRLVSTEIFLCRRPVVGILIDTALVVRRVVAVLTSLEPFFVVALVHVRIAQLVYIVKSASTPVHIARPAAQSALHLVARLGRDTFIQLLRSVALHEGQFCLPTVRVVLAVPIEEVLLPKVAKWLLLRPRKLLILLVVYTAQVILQFAGVVLPTARQCIRIGIAAFAVSLQVVRVVTAAGASAPALFHRLLVLHERVLAVANAGLAQ